VHVTLLGTAAGGGFPQWNCWCPPCRTAREAPQRALPRTQSSVAVSADGARWFLLNASPDVREQLSRLPAAAPPPDAVRHVPVEGVVLTDAELDHTLGMVLLREARALTLYATSAVRGVLERDSKLLPTVRAFADVRVCPLPLDAPVELAYRDGSPSALSVDAFTVEGDPPRFAAVDEAGHTVGLVVQDATTRGTLAFVPGCGVLDEATLTRLAGTDLVLFDGTFWRSDELIQLGISESTAERMGHVPMSGPGGSLERLAALPSRMCVYTHINNSNPVLVEGSAEGARVRAAGVEIGRDGMTFTL